MRFHNPLRGWQTLWSGAVQRYNFTHEAGTCRAGHTPPTRHAKTVSTTGAPLQRPPKFGVTQLRTHLLSIATVTILAASGAMATTTTNGTIKAMDMAKHSITLTDGTVYTLPLGFKVAGLKVGEKVAVIWDKKGAVNEATAVTMAK